MKILDPYIATMIPPSLGVIRKQLGLTFLGETRDGERFIFADMYVQGLDSEVRIGV